MMQVKEALIAEGFDPCRVSIGDTPSCSVIDDFTNADEIRPGNFVFYDVMQLTHGVCTDDDIAVMVACPIIGKYPHRKQVVIYGGAIHFGKEQIVDDKGNQGFGYISEESEPFGKINYNTPVISLSQEHGIVQADDCLLSDTKIGDIVYVYPIHSCLTCGLYPEYMTMDGDRISRLRWMSARS
jgi:D-serine deaminase-like pyridoxal phosphate-dependent protein